MKTYQEFITEAVVKGPKFKVKAFAGDAEDFGSLKRNGYSFLGGDGKEINTYAKRREIAYIVAGPKVDADDIEYDFDNFGIVSGGKA
ncbi:hypothetical protein ACSYPE_000197 [Shigella sonnei]|uniref:Uncharacterized protein n=1 Tax=Shigella phage JK45 TaxID=2591063 RepID=A0A5B9MY21_9CAUD|nr:internal head protein [Shigella phage JK45]QEG06511.1 hypothetical protein JK45_00122 [Shigella phage JK45]QHR72691.1 hypothetical protein mobillu_86 [Escherichia phage mobillu]HAX4052697.1 hypothetical protein [Escherichia coli]